MQRACAKLQSDPGVKLCCKDLRNWVGPFATEQPECVIYRCVVCDCRKWILDGAKAFNLNTPVSAVPTR